MAMQENHYWALFVDTPRMEAWLKIFDVSEAPQQGCLSGQSYGVDRAAAVAACQELAKSGYSVAVCDLV